MKRYRFDQLEVPLSRKDDAGEVLAQVLHVHVGEIRDWQIDRMALDSRRRGRPHWSCNVIFSCTRDLRHPGVKLYSDGSERLEDQTGARSLSLAREVAIVGAGPAGLWAAWSLLQRGYTVDLYEQGQPVEIRFRDIRHFLKGRKLDTRSNILFGEGGAGAFSDGKLNTRTRNAFSQRVLNDLVKAGGDPSIAYFAKPHVGTDRLQFLIREVRRWILEAGGRIHFGARLEDIDIRDGAMHAIRIENEWKPCGALVLAVGHSARDVYRMLHARGVALEAKSFAMGVRVEHPQHLVNERQLGKGTDVALAGSAEYSLTCQTRLGKSAAYSFCMCPGGVLVPCASEEGGFATNGMSYSRRNSPYANSGIIVPQNFSTDLWAGLDAQRQLESDAFREGGGDYTAPAQTIEAFLSHRPDTQALPKSSYPCGLKSTNHWDWMSADMCESLAEGFLNFEKKIPGFIRTGLMVSPETRTSSPVRILRKPDSLESANVQGLYPLGEGAGYAGGIVTSAADGVKLAVFAQPCRPEALFD